MSVPIVIVVLALLIWISAQQPTENELAWIKEVWACRARHLKNGPSYLVTSRGQCLRATAALWFGFEDNGIFLFMENDEHVQEIAHRNLAQWVHPEFGPSYAWETLCLGWWFTYAVRIDESP